MDIALSMRYGGAVVHPEDCDESSYKKLGLLCPACRDLVMFRPESERNVRGKVYSVKAHFSHFPSKGDTAALACEKRISSLTPDQRKSLAANGRRQQYKLFQRWFWRILQSYLIRPDLDPKALDLMFLSGEYEEYKLSESLNNDIRQFGQPKFQSLATEAAYEWMDLLSSPAGEAMLVQFQKKESLDSEETVASWYRAMKELADRRLHRDIVREAILFLGAKKNFEILRGLYIYWLLGSDVSDYMQFDGPDIRNWIFERIGQMMALVPWGEEFAKVKDCDAMPVFGSSGAGIFYKFLQTEVLRLSETTSKEKAVEHLSSFLADPI